MKIYDVSAPLYPGMPVYPGDPEFSCEQIPAGDAVISSLSLGTHTGTHIDAPAHYLSGAPGIDDIPLTQLICRAGVTAVGCDMDSAGDTAVHKMLLENNTVIIENLCLESVPCGEYSMVALPLKIVSADAAPARVVLLDTQIE